MFGIQVMIGNEWCWLQTSGKPYKYPTQDKASEVMRICYPDQVREHRLGGKQSVRVTEFKETQNGYEY